jgi:hypothetical protein
MISVIKAKLCSLIIQNGQASPNAKSWKGSAGHSPFLEKYFCPFG